MNKEQIKERIEEINIEIQMLNSEKKSLTNELINNSDSLRDKINAILSSDNESTWIMSYTNGGLLDDELTGDRYNRRETVDVNDMLENILTRDFCDTWEDQKIINEIFDMENMTEEQYNEYIKGKYNRVHSIDAFYTMIDDIIKENVSSFTFDW